jgi:prolyl-tRNA editing enzyme YbaK/EbsC (Cys-tRNA(Pro) deacylase)
VERADPEWVRERTGFAIGGIPPLAHATPPTVIVDRDVVEEDELWAAAGTPHTMFRTSGAVLESLTGGRLAPVAST